MHRTFQMLLAFRPRYGLKYATTRPAILNMDTSRTLSYRISIFLISFSFRMKKERKKRQHSRSFIVQNMLITQLTLSPLLQLYTLSDQHLLSAKDSRLNQKSQL